MPTLILALLCLICLTSPVQAAQLEAVRPFTVDNQARVLLVLSDTASDPDAASDAATAPAPLELRTRASAPVGAIAGRGITWLAGVRMAEDLPAELPVDSDGVRRVLLAQVGDGLQVTVELDDARIVRAQRIHGRAVMVDLVSADQDATQGSDAGLPTVEQLVAFVEGVDLVRAAGGTPKTRPLVVVDAGHGGWDHGAVGVTGTREADIALQLARKAAAGMRAELDADVILTRDSDVFLTLTQRAQVANNAKADLFLSVHANAAFGPGAWGIETYSMDTASDKGAARVASRENSIARQLGEDEESDRLSAQLINQGTMRLSKELAAQVQAGVCGHLGTVYGKHNVRDLGTKTALFTVLTRTRMPAILFESSFVSNPTDERRLRAPHFQQAIADALTTAVGRWLDRQGQGQPTGPMP